jgi:uncharacterized protein YgiM (DUF1202 family)
VNAQVVPNFNAYCRKGPGPYYDAITYLLTGTAYKVTGRDNSSSWWQIQAPGNVTCWVMGTSVTTQGAAAQVSIVSAPPLPVTPGQFVSSFKCQISVKKFSVALNWMAVNNATGYRIYRNGTVLLELPPASTSYSDNPPLKVNLVYELEAFNDYGVAPRISTTVQACE